MYHFVLSKFHQSDLYFSDLIQISTVDVFYDFTGEEEYQFALLLYLFLFKEEFFNLLVLLLVELNARVVNLQTTTAVPFHGAAAISYQRSAWYRR